jgi:hypothetical protein
MTDAILQPPMHPREQVQSFGHMSENDDYQASCAQELQEDVRSLSP